jgi:hypothetical protein
MMHIGGVGALPGTTLFSGDIIHVGAGGSASVTLAGGTPLRFSEQTQLLLSAAGAENEIEFEVYEGRAEFRTTRNGNVVARLADATIRGAGDTPSVGVIGVVNDMQAYVAATAGDLLISTAHDARTFTLKQGHVVDVRFAPAPQGVDTPQPTATNKLNARRAALIAFLGVATVITIGLLLAFKVRDLSDADKKNLISPFRFP